MLLYRGHCRLSTSSPKSLLSTTGVSHLGAVASAATRKQDSAGLTPTLCNYVNTQLMHHIAGWQTDTAEKQVLLRYFVVCRSYPHVFRFV